MTPSSDELLMILEEQRETNRLLRALIEALAEEPLEEPTTSYLDGSSAPRPHTTEVTRRG